MARQKKLSEGTPPRIHSVPQNCMQFWGDKSEIRAAGVLRKGEKRSVKKFLRAPISDRGPAFFYPIRDGFAENGMPFSAKPSQLDFPRVLLVPSGHRSEIGARKEPLFPPISILFPLPSEEEKIRLFSDISPDSERSRRKSVLFLSEKGPGKKDQKSEENPFFSPSHEMAREKNLSHKWLGKKSSPKARPRKSIYEIRAAGGLRKGEKRSVKKS